MNHPIDFDLTSLPQRQAKHYGARPAFWTKADGATSWQPVSWTEFDTLVGKMAYALQSLGITPGDKVAIYSQNRLESFVIDFANFRLQGATVPMYATASAEQVAYIANDAQVKIICAGDPQQLQAVQSVASSISSLTHIVCLFPNAPCGGNVTSFSALIQTDKSIPTPASAPNINEQIATLIYTSGTTGDPKGVILTHGNYAAALELNHARLSLDENDIALSFLPISHVFERAWSYLCLALGAQIYINYNPKEITTSLREVRPTTMCAVPRLWEKIYLAAMRKVLALPSPIKAFAVWAFDQGRKYNLVCLNHDTQPRFWLKVGHFIAEKLLLHRLRSIIGLDRGHFFPVAGSSLSDHIMVLLKGIGIPLLYGYGLTETTATVSCFPNHDYRIGSVGTVLDGVQVRIGDDDEILVKGPTVTPGYYNKPDANAEAFTSDGFFRTGDAGRLDKGGHLYLTERLKDLMKTSNGKYIAPQQIEMRLSANPYIEQAIVIGDKRPYVTAIVVPAFDALRELPQFADMTDDQIIANASANGKVYQHYEREINAAQEGMAPFEHIKKFTLIKKGFSLASGELTNTLKFRRTIISQRHAEIINRMYDKRATSILPA